MSLRTELTCGTCGGSGVHEPTPSFSESHPLPVPCPDCVEGIPRTLIEEFKSDEYREAALYVLKALRDREEPHE